MNDNVRILAHKIEQMQLFKSFFPAQVHLGEVEDEEGQKQMVAVKTLRLEASHSVRSGSRKFLPSFGFASFPSSHNSLSSFLYHIHMFFFFPPLFPQISFERDSSIIAALNYYRCLFFNSKKGTHHKGHVYILRYRFFSS